MELFFQHLAQFIGNHWQLWLTLLVILVLIFVNEVLTLRQRAKTLSTAALVDMINNENAVVFDLRPLEAFQAGHIISAKRASEEEFSQPRMATYKNQPIILICPRGVQSSALAAKLRKLGFTQPMVLSGGMSAWQAANLPIVKGK